MGIRTRTSGIMVNINVQPSGVATDPATTAWVNAVIADGGSVSATQQTNVNALIVALKGHGIWTLLDRLWLYGGESDTHQAKIDIVNLQSHTITVAPTFGAGGYTGNAVDQFINTNFVPSAGGSLFIQDSASFGGYIRTNRAVQDYDLMGTLGGGHICELLPFGGTSRCDINWDGFDTFTSTASQGFWHLNRSGASATQVYYDGGALTTGNPTSQGLPNLAFFVLGRNLGGGINRPSADQIAAVFIGGSMTAAQAANFNTDIEAYMDAWGIGVQ